MISPRHRLPIDTNFVGLNYYLVKYAMYEGTQLNRLRAAERPLGFWEITHFLVKPKFKMFLVVGCILGPINLTFCLGAFVVVGSL